MAKCNCDAKERHDWFPLHAMVFLQSDTAQDCEPWEIQCFLHMLTLAWAGPGIPTDRLGRRLGLPPERVKQLMAGPVGEKWTECCGKLWNETLETERDKSQAIREAKQAAGRKGGRASGRARSKSQAELKQSEAGAKQVLPENEAVLPENEAKRTTGHNTTGHNTTEDPPNPPEGGSADRPRRSAKPSRAGVEKMARAAALPEGVVAAVLDWDGHRRDIGKVVTRRAWQALIADAQADGPLFAASVNHSVKSGYTGLFPPGTANGQSAERLTARAAQQRRNRSEALAALEEWGDDNPAPAPQSPARGLTGTPEAKLRIVEAEGGAA